METLLEEISSQILASSSIKLLYLTTQPIEIRPLTPIPKTQPRIPTIKIRHFFNVVDASTDITIFGIEILVYLNIYPTHVDHYIFVSKCDTVGKVKPNFRVGDIVQCFLRYVASIDLNTYRIHKPKEIKQKAQVTTDLAKEYDIYQTDTHVRLNQIIENLQDLNYYRSIKEKGTYERSVENVDDKDDSKLVSIPPVQHQKLCLFTKTSKQYLFPKSYKNQYKHMVNGQQLLKWWVDVIVKATKDQGWLCRLLIPGSDPISTQKFISQKPQWTIGHIFDEGQAVYRIPLFPDDPKGRFLEHLIVENRYKQVDVNGFYQELGYRQEFRLSDLVGLIGCENTTTSHKHTAASAPCTLAEYKQVLTTLKNANYSLTEDIKAANNAVSSIVQTEYIIIHGKKEKPVKAEALKAEPVNMLTVKRKPNDLNGLVRKKKRV